MRFTTRVVCHLLRYDYRSSVRFTTRLVCDLLRYDYRSSVRWNTRVVCDLLRYDYRSSVRFTIAVRGVSDVGLAPVSEERRVRYRKCTGTRPVYEAYVCDLPHSFFGPREQFYHRSASCEEEEACVFHDSIIIL